MIHDSARVVVIRARVVAQLELIKMLEAKIVKGKHTPLEVARKQTEDIETIFLEDLEKRDRTSSEEAHWLSSAEQLLETWVPYLKETDEQFSKFGGSIVIVDA